MLILREISVRWQRLAAALALAALVFATTTQAGAQTPGRLIDGRELERHGLVRGWYAQVRLDPSRHRVVRWILSGDKLLILTSAGFIHALDAHSGATQWITPVGNPDYPSLGPAASEPFVAVVNGSTLYVLDRQTGKIKIQRKLGGGAGAGPALATDFVFVPLLGGRIEGYSLHEGWSRPWFYQSFGRALVTPLAAADVLVWTTDYGYLYVAQSNVPAVRFRLETPNAFLAPPAYQGRTIYAISAGGELYAINDRNGSRRWKYATGYPTVRAPAVIGGRIYVSSDEPALHSVDAETGIGYWEAPDVAEFASASGEHVYGADQFGTIVVLSRETGALLGKIPTAGVLTALVNEQTDRLYLISEHGLVQCLHERDLVEPMHHAAESDEAATAAVAPSEAQPAPSSPSPFAPAEPPEATAPGGASPFAPQEAAPTEEAPAEQSSPADENPFGVLDDNPFAVE